MEEHIRTLVEAANAAGIRTFLYKDYEEMYDVNSEFLDIE